MLATEVTGNGRKRGQRSSVANGEYDKYLVPFSKPNECD